MYFGRCQHEITYRFLFYDKSMALSVDPRAPSVKHVEIIPVLIARFETGHRPSKFVCNT